MHRDGAERPELKSHSYDVPCMPPNVYIIAGPNGAGKTTFAREFLPNYAHCKNFVNADLIAAGVSPFDPAAAAVRAGRLMLGEIEALAARRLDFSFESTLSGRTYLSLLRALRDRGYLTHLFYLWIPDASFAVARVKARVAAGGHSIPESIIRRRFERSITNFFRLYQPLADSWMFFDNSDRLPEALASGVGADIHESHSHVYAKLKSRYGRSV